MRGTIRFSRAFIPAVIISSLIVISGAVGWAVKGFNMGVDFRAGLNEQVRLALPAMEISYSGEGNAQFQLTNTQAQLVISGTLKGDRTLDMPYDQYPTVGSIVAEVQKVPGVSAAALGGSETASTELIPTQNADTQLKAEKTLSHRRIQASEGFATIEQVRKAISDLGEAAVQTVGEPGQQTYMIRVGDTGTDPDFAKNIGPKVRADLEAAFGADRVIIAGADLVGASFSKNLGSQAVWLVILALGGILVYALIRFKPAFAFGAVLTVIHDALVMIAFIVWTGMEFNTSSIAAILTILGYSINDTIVIFDRIRENLKLKKDAPYVQTLDEANTQVLGRTAITSGTTLLAVVVLFVATTGSMRDFALALIVGIVSGTYSSVFIGASFLTLWQNIADKRASKKEGHAVGTAKAAKA